MPPRVPITSSKRAARPGRARPPAQVQVDLARARLEKRKQQAVTASPNVAAEFDEIQQRRDGGGQTPDVEVQRTLTALDSRLGRLEKKLDRILEALGEEEPEEISAPAEAEDPQAAADTAPGPQEDATPDASTPTS